MKKTGIELIAAERERQINEEGWTPEHDKQYRQTSKAVAMTREEQAREYTKSMIAFYESDDHWAKFHQSFLAGYSAAESLYREALKEATEWISFDEKLPPASDNDILIKGEDHRGVMVVDVAYMHGPGMSVGNIISLAGEVLRPKFWRPIDSPRASALLKGGGE